MAKQKNLATQHIAVHTDLTAAQVMHALQTARTSMDERLAENGMTTTKSKGPVLAEVSGGFVKLQWKTREI